jgi:hypothetical protein
MPAAAIVVAGLIGSRTDRLESPATGRGRRVVRMVKGTTR